jgi:hypothetical protein
MALGILANCYHVDYQLYDILFLFRLNLKTAQKYLVLGIPASDINMISTGSGGETLGAATMAAKSRRRKEKRKELLQSGSFAAPFVAFTALRLFCIPNFAAC